MIVVTTGVVVGMMARGVVEVGAGDKVLLECFLIELGVFVFVLSH